MEIDNNKKIDEILELLEENNKMLRHIRGSQRRSQIFRLLYIVVIIALTAGAYYYINPYISQVMDAYSGIQDTLGGIGEIPSNISNANQEAGNLLKGGNFDINSLLEGLGQ